MSEPFRSDPSDFGYDARSGIFGHDIPADPVERMLTRVRLRAQLRVLWLRTSRNKS